MITNLNSYCNMKATYNLLILVFLLSSCSVIRKSAKTAFTDGYYIQNLDNKKQVVFVDIDEEALRIHPIIKDKHLRAIDSTKVCQYYPKEMSSAFRSSTSFAKYTLDIDFLTMPLKYRPAQSTVPAQLNTNLNGALYLGFRTDNYRLNYYANPLKKSDRNIIHYGVSVGIFTGFGNTSMNATTTNNYLSSEYDGIVWTKGIAGIIAVNNFSLGLALGFDNLLDQNKIYWIYETKPWFGLAFGLNLN